MTDSGVVIVRVERGDEKEKQVEERFEWRRSNVPVPSGYERESIRMYMHAIDFGTSFSMSCCFSIIISHYK
jgi:hypothetical protein